MNESESERGEGDGGIGDIRKSFFLSDSDYWLRQNGDVSTGFSKDEGIEGETQGGWRRRPEGGRNEKDIKEGERTDRERTKQAIRRLPHISGCDFGNCS